MSADRVVMDDFEDCDEASADAAAEPGPADGLLPPWTAGESLWGYVQWSDDADGGDENADDD